jgi:hypothetical protein
MTNKYVFCNCKKCNYYLLHHAKGLCRSCYDHEISLKKSEQNKQKARKYYKDNKQKYLENNFKNYHLGKGKARKYAKILKLIDKECKFCKSKNKLNFHHTDYNNNLGFTLCHDCHVELHRQENLKRKVEGELNA